MSEDRNLYPSDETLIAAYKQKGIVPITFVGDDVEASDATNTLYTLPYLSMVAIQQAGKGLQYDSIEKRNTLRAIISYLEMNIYGMVYDTLVSFTDQVFRNVGCSGKHQLFPAEKVGVIFKDIVGEGNPLDLRYEIREAIETSGIYSVIYGISGPDFEKSMDLSTAHISHLRFTSIMDQVFAILIESVFNRFINLIIEWHMNNKKFVPLFAEMWKQVYNDYSDKVYDDITKANDNPAVMVEFVGGYMRSVMELYMPRFRAGLDMLSWYSAKMNEAGGNYGESNSTKES